MRQNEPVRLRRPTPEQWTLARTLLAREEEGAPGITGSLEAMQAASVRLAQHLSTFFGQEGAAVLLNRALTLARREHRFLEKVELLEDGGLAGLPDAVEGIQVETASEGIVAILAYVVWILSTFVGEELTLRLIGEIWPAQANRMNPPDREEVEK